MDAQDVAKMLGYASTIDPKISAGSTMMVKTWAGLLADVPVDAARAAIDEHYRASTDTVMPAHILTHWKDAKRRDAEQRHASDVKEISSGPVIEHEHAIAELYARFTAQRRGTDPDEAEAEAGARQAVSRIECPYCHARPGTKCVTPTGHELSKALAHPARFDALYATT